MIIYSLKSKIRFSSETDNFKKKIDFRLVKSIKSYRTIQGIIKAD